MRKWERARRGLAVCLAVLLLIGLLPGSVFAAGLTVGIPSLGKALYAGTKTTLTLTIYNQTGTPITGETAALTGTADVAVTTGPQTVDIPANGSASVTYNIEVGLAAAASTQELTLDVGADTFPVRIPILPDPLPPTDPDPDPQPPAAAPLVLESFAARQAQILAGTRVDLDFTLTSPEWQPTLGQIRVTVETNDSVLLPAGQTNTVMIDPVSRTRPGQGSIAFDVRAGVETQMVSFRITMEYVDQYGKNQTVSVSRTLKVTGANAPAGGEKLSLANFSLPGGVIVPGRQFTAQLSVKNLGAEELRSLTLSVKNLSAAGISPVGDGGIARLETLAAGQTSQISFTLYAAASLPSGVTEIEVGGVYTTKNGAQGTFSQTFYVSVTAPENPGTAGLRIVSAEAKGAAAGQNVNLVVLLENTGKTALEQIALTVSGMSPNGAMLQGTLDVFHVGTLRGGEQRSVAIPLKIAASASGYVTLGLTPSFAGGTGEPQNVYLPVIGGTGEPGSVLMLTALSAEGVAPGADFMLTYTLQNTGTAALSNLRIRFDGGVFVPASGLNLFTVGKLEAGASITRTIQMRASSSVGAGMTPVSLVVEYAGGTETVGGYLQVTGAAVDGSVPRVMIDSYELDPENVTAGGRFTFAFRLKNTSKTVAIQNIKLTLSSADGVFSPVAGSNTFYTESIAPEGVEEYSIALSAKAQAEQKSYPILIGVEYEYGTSGRYNGDEQINVYVSQPTRLEFTNINYPTMVMMGESVYFSMQYFNKGKSALNNLTVRVEGDFMLAEGEQFIGNFPAGSGDYFETQLIPQGMGTVAGMLVFVFEDAAGEERLMEIPLTVEVMEGGEPVGPDPGNPEPLPPVEDEKPAWKTWKWYVWAAVGVGVALVVLVPAGLIVRTVKNKRMRKTEEDWNA